MAKLGHGEITVTSKVERESSEGLVDIPGYSWILMLILIYIYSVCIYIYNYVYIYIYITMYIYIYLCIYI